MGTATATPADEWDRRRLLRTLALVTLAGVLLLAGLGLAVHAAATSLGRSGTAPGPGAQPAQADEQLPPGQSRRDAVAAAPMLKVPPQAGRSGTPAATPAPTITIPPAGWVGPAGVPTGFPHTPAGALGQLAAIETSVLQGMSIEHAREVHQAWADPDAVPADGWELTANIQAFLASAAGARADEPTTTVVATPVAALVKGSDGPDWVLACVLLDVRARVATQARIAYGHCERMQWTDSATDTGVDGGGRWVIGPGPAPARAPSTWPGTDLAAQAGWATWVTGPDQ